MQHGYSIKPIVGDLKGVSYCYRRRGVTDDKRAAQRRHRRRVNQDMQRVASGSMTDEAFDESPREGLDAWDVW